MTSQHDKEVRTVDHVTAEIVAPTPPLLGVPHLLVTALGTVTTTGWSKGHLVLRPHQPVHGVYELDFVALPPPGVAGDIIEPMAGSIVIQNPQRDARAVRVHASGGSKEAPIHPHHK